MIKNMLNWHHSGFNVYCGNAIWPHNDEGFENLARYIIRASLSQEWMTYISYDESADGVAGDAIPTPSGLRALGNEGDGVIWDFLYGKQNERS